MVLSLLLSVVMVDPAAPPKEKLVVKVARETTVIEEKSLLMDSSMQAREHGAQLGKSYNGDPEGRVEPALGFNQNMVGNSVVDGEEAPTARRIYLIPINPGENLIVDMKCQEHGKVFMQWAVPPKVHGMTSSIKRSNMPLRSTRASRIRLGNDTKEPYEAALVCLGQHNYSYKLTITRK